MDKNSDLKTRAFAGSIWSFLEKTSVLLVQFTVGVILARLLSPEDYGLVALTLIFTTIAAAITDGGFEKSLINKHVLTELQINTVFYINILLGFLIMLGIIVSAPAISAFFKEPDLIPVLRFVSLGIFINAIGQTPSALLRKELLFKKVSYAHMLGSLASAVTGLSLAYSGFGVWALVYSTLAAQLVTLLIYMFYSPWRPALQFSFASIRSMLPYGLNVLFSSSVSFFLQQFNSLIIGKWYNKADLGLFHRGSRLPELVTSVIEGVVLKLAFPLFSKVQNDAGNLSQVLKKTMKILAFVTFPLLIFLLFNARDITLLLFTSKWEGSVIYMEIFCVIKLFYPFTIIYKEILLAKGDARLFSRLVTFFSVFEVILVLLIAKFGVIYILIATLISVSIQYFTYGKIISDKIHIPFFEQLRWLTKYIMMAILLALTITLTDHALAPLEDALQLKLMIKSLASLVVYVTMAWLFRVDEINHLIFFYRSFIKRAPRQVEYE